jgi:hypothetical protein
MKVNHNQNNDCWKCKSNHVDDRYMQMMKDNKVVYSDVYIGVNNN